MFFYLKGDIIKQISIFRIIYNLIFSSSVKEGKSNIIQIIQVKRKCFGGYKKYKDGWDKDVKKDIEMKKICI